MNDDRLFNSSATDRTYEGAHLDAIDFPVGPIGGSVIRMNGRAERFWWHIFNNWEETSRTSEVPNSFFAIRTKDRERISVRALQSTPVGPFAGMHKLVFTGEYPYGWYDFIDPELPVAVRLEVYNPLIPMNAKDSSIPCAIFRIATTNLLDVEVEVGLMASQRNVTGCEGLQPVHQPQDCPGGENWILQTDTATSLKMIGRAGSMHLSGLGSAFMGSASVPDLDSAYRAFLYEGSVSGESHTERAENGPALDGVLARSVLLAAHETSETVFILSWHFPNGSFGDKRVPEWSFPDAGQQYENWWSSAEAVDSYVRDEFSSLESRTRTFHDAFFSSKIPHYLLDRVMSQLVVIRSPTTFWTKSGYLGLWESTSSNEQWYGNCKHVYHYAQAHARLFPELGRRLRDQDIQTQTNEGLFPSRTGEDLNALDGHFGTILSCYREHLLTDDTTWLESSWPSIKRAMDYAISVFDADHDGLLSGRAYHNTLDCNVSGTSPWIGTLYLAALRATAKMARILDDELSQNLYDDIWERGCQSQNNELWNARLEYYVEKSDDQEETLVMADACSIDMFLGQWWANQLDLGQIYPEDRTRLALSRIFVNNKVTNDGNYESVYRCFLGPGDTGWTMFHFPGDVPSNSIRYHNEVMSGFEYSLAATLIQYGMDSEGFEVIRAVADRYDGRLRGESEVSCWENACVYGSGSPFGDDECGDFYGRAMSSWAVLLALQGFLFDGPKRKIGFTAPWRPNDHESFFTTSSGWGSFRQSRDSGRQSSRIEVKFGHVEVQEVVLADFWGVDAESISATLDRHLTPIASITKDGERVHLRFEKPFTIRCGSSLEIVMSHVVD